MGREIKFRAWYAPKPAFAGDEEAKPKMLYFDNIGYCDEYNHLSFDLEKRSRNPEGGNYSNLCADVENFSDLMQYTGLKDKNDKEIYEGDILSPSKRVVEFCTDVRLKSVYETYGGAGFYTRAHQGTGRPEELGVFSFGVTQAEVSEIIGNIYENPKLLDVEQTTQ